MSYTFDNKIGKRNGLITTIVVHAVLLILCLFLGFTYLDPLAGDVAIGFEALGIPDAGSSDSPSATEEITDLPQEVTENVAQSVPTPVDQSYATQDNSPVNVKASKPVKPEKTAEQIQKEKEEQEKKDKQAKLDKMLSNIKGDSPGAGKGDNGKAGNDGDPNGIPNGEGGNGGFGGDGKGGNGGDGMFNFGGRKAKSPGNLKHDCGVQGSVKLRVKVDRQGNVVDAFLVSGGTSFNQCLINKAISAAKSTQYNSNQSGPEFQEGTITLNFSLN